MKDFIYLQIKEYLLALIAANFSNQYYRLPSENQLAIKFNASRVSVTTAYNELARENKIYRVQGKGSFIVNPAFDNLGKKLTSNNRFVTLIMPNFATDHSNKIIFGFNSYMLSVGITYTIMISHSAEDVESLRINEALKLGCAGLAIYPASGTKFNKDIVDLSFKNFPIVLIDRRMKGLNLACVSSNHKTTSYDMTNILITQGHKYIGIVETVNLSSSSSNERLSGYKTALLEHNIKVTTTYIFSNLQDNTQLTQHDMNSLTNIEQKFEKYISTNPELTAIISTGGSWGMKLYTTLKKLNRLDIQLCFFDYDHANYLPLMDTHVYAIEQDNYKIGYTTAEKLVQLMTGYNYDTSNIYIPHKIHLD